MKTNFPVANLGDHVRQVSQRNKGESGTEVFSVTNSEGFTRSTDYFSKEVFSKDISNYKVVRKGQFAYNPSRINVGSIDYLRPAEKALVSPLYVVFETDSELSADYLLRYVKSDWGNAQIRANTEGAVRDSLKYKGLESIKIPLPPLEDQKRIAHLLGKVEGLIARRKQHLQQLDDLLKSVFLEMFGDPVRNEKGWEKPELKHFGKISTGNTPPRKNPSNYSSRHIEWIKTDNISADSVFISQAAEYLSETGATKARTVTNNALMVACIAGSIESIGRAALTDRTVAFNQQINAIQPKKEVDPLFLYVLFKISKAYIQSHASKGMKKILTKGDFEKITMIKPSVELQNHFAAIVEKVDTLKSRYQQSLTDLESLYGALSQKAFKGELDLSRIPLGSEKQEMHEERHEEATTPFESVLPKHIKATLENLNAFNQSASSLMAAHEVAVRFFKLDLPQLDAVRRATEQLAALPTPFHEMKQMVGISEAMEQAQAAIKSMGFENMESISKTAELARTMAINIPKIDLGWLEQQKDLLRNATEPFESMRKAMESISWPSKSLQESIRLQSETAKRLHSSIPDFISWKKQAVDLDAVDFEDEDGAAKRLFTREDVTDIFAYVIEPISFDSLLHELGELGTVDFAGYETIKASLFDLLDEKQLTQIFDNEMKFLLFSSSEKGPLQ